MKQNFYKKILIGLPLFLFVNFFLINPVFAGLGTIFLSPGSGSFQIGNEFLTKLMIDTDGVSINAAQVKLYFATDTLEVVDISRENSIMSLWPQEPSYSNETGEISLIGGLPQPGFHGTGELINIKFRAKKESEAVFYYDESKLLANDGLGTNILSYLKGAKYLVYSEEKLKENQPKIFSLTHPNENEWYSNDSPEFQWSSSENSEGASFTLDQNSDTIPDEISEGLVNSKKYDQIADGTWYFHLRLKNNGSWGKTTNYSVKIDTNPPRDFEIVVDNQGDPTNPSPKMYFETQDDTSGIYKYRIKIGDNDFFDLMAAQITYFAPKLNPGNYKIIVRAVDMAYNVVRANTYLDIAPIETPIITISPENYIAGEETMYIEGTAVPDSSVTIFLKKGGEKIRSWQTITNKDGQWVLSANDLIKPGVYYLSAMAQDNRGAISNNSEDIRINISFNGLNAAGLMFTFKNLIVILIIILLFAAASAIYVIFRSHKNKKILIKETQEAKNSLAKNFSGLEEELQRKIELFDQKPGFNDQEKKVYEELKQSLKTAEESIDKEIKDIERGIK